MGCPISGLRLEKNGGDIIRISLLVKNVWKQDFSKQHTWE